MRLIFALLFLFSYATAWAETRSRLTLQAFVPQLSKVNIQEIKRKPGHYRWLIENFQNSYHLHSQKIEIEGLSQQGFEGELIKISDSDQLIRHEILLNLIDIDNTERRPIFIKISAN